MADNYSELAIQLKSIYKRNVIPVTSDKRPFNSLKWSTFNSHLLMTDNETAALFRDPSIHGVAVITGGNIACLDIDSHSKALRFKATYPALWNTSRTKTPRGYHLFYNVSKLKITTRRWKRADFLHSGAYVVDYPTPGYTPEHGGAPLQLAAGDYMHIELFFNPSNQEIDGAINDNEFEVVSQDAYENLGQESLQRIYQLNCQRLGRNQALFKTAIDAHYNGVGRSVAIAALLSHHIDAPPPADHKAESSQSRQMEALATIASAYRYPVSDRARVINRTGLPASIRQSLYQRNMKYLARALDPLYRAGTAGCWLTRSDIADHAGDRVGDWSRRRAYDSQIGPDRVLDVQKLAHERAPSPRPFPETANAVTDTPTALKNYVHSSGAKPTKTHFEGRPPYAYRIPTLSELADLLGVMLFFGSKIDASSLATVKTYGAASLIELIARYEGVALPIKWLAGIFGVHICTIKRWRRAAGVVSIPTIESARLTKFNFDSLASVPAMGVWLQDVNGARYPATKIMGAMLLRKRLTPVICRQRPNRYYVTQNRLETATAKLTPQFIPTPAANFEKPLTNNRFEKLTTLTTTTIETAPNNPLETIHRALEMITDHYWRPGWCNGETGLLGSVPKGERSKTFKTKVRKEQIELIEPWSGESYEDRAAEITLLINLLVENRTYCDKSRRVSLQTIRRALHLHGLNEVERALAYTCKQMSAGYAIKNVFGYLVSMIGVKHK